MKITGSEIRKKTFKTKLHGYDIAEVTAFLSEMAVEWEAITGHNSQMKEKIIEAETKVKDYVAMEKAIQQTFMQAQETSGRVVENARKEEQLILHEAELKASQLLEKARQDLISLKENVSILQAKRDSIVNRLKMLLTSEMDALKTMAPDERTDEIKGTSGAEAVNGRSEIEDIVKSIE